MNKSPLFRLVFLLASLAFAVAPLEHARALTASFSNATTPVLTVPSFTATGTSVDISLNFAPVTGTNLTIIKNTGLDFIHGTFTNLPQGQSVAFTFGADVYHFVANYYGGNGNDLVLQWSDTRLLAWGYNNVGQLGDNSLANHVGPQPVLNTGVLEGKTVTALAVGDTHSLALCSDGTMAAWGGNNAGQLGINSIFPSAVPVEVMMPGPLALKKVVSIAAGGSHNLALCSDGTLLAWGGNNFGQLGDNSTYSSYVPITVYAAGALSGKTVVAIAGGNAHSLALLADGKLVAWGNNDFGQLGDGVISGSLTPRAVTQGLLSGRTVVSIAAGNLHNLALCSNGAVAAFGYNAYGQLGTNSFTNSPMTDVTYTTALSFGPSAVAAAGYHSLAVNSDGVPAAWGASPLGNNTIWSSSTAVAVTITDALAGKTIIAVSGGASHHLALCSDGTLAAWGSNNYGQVGDNTITARLVPVSVARKPGYRFLAAVSGNNASHSLGLVAEAPPSQRNALLSGLSPGVGSLVPGFSAGTSTYVLEVPGTTASIQLTPTVADSRATVKINGVVAASGSPSGGIALGYGDTELRTVVTAVDGLTAFTYTTTVRRPWPTMLPAHFSSAADVPLVISDLYLAEDSSVDLSLDFAPAPGTALTIVRNPGLDFIHGTFSNVAQGQSVALTFGGDTYYFVANYYGGNGNDLVLQWADTRLMAWGDNAKGQLGNNTGRPSLGPVPVQSTGVLAGKTVIATAMGDKHSLALCSDGTMAAWGGNEEGQLGNNSNVDSPVPVDITSSGVLAGRTVIAISAGVLHSVALCSDGTVAAWGANANGQLGIGNTVRKLVPVQVTASTGGLAGQKVVAVAAGGYHNLALCSGGTLVSWGSGTGAAQNLVPLDMGSKGVLAGRIVIAMTAGGSHSLALCSDGTLAAWGYNASGQLGTGDTATSILPVAISDSGVLAGRTVIALATGGSHNLALCSDGTLAAWGSNSYGQVGDNSTSDALLPVKVLATGVLAGRTVVAISAASTHSFAQCSDGTLTAWGNNISGQLGTGTINTSRAPLAVSTASLAASDRFGSIALGKAGLFSLGVIAQSPPSQRNAQLASLVPSNGTLTPVFAAETMAYLLEVPSETAYLQLTPTTADGSATVKINGVPVPSGSFSPGISLSFGDTMIRSVVTARDGFTTRTYAVTVRRSLPGNVLEGSFTAATDVPLTCDGLIATGNSLSLSLNYAPLAGTSLTLVRNTRLGFITGTFSNLAQGQVVSLVFGGKTYDFVAHYFGGSSGRDLVLQWQHIRLMGWGNNQDAQVGGLSVGQQWVPAPIDTNTVLRHKNVLSAAAGDHHSLALCGDGTLAAWGLNLMGQLGDNRTTGSADLVSVTMTGVLAGKQVAAVAVGTYHSLALCSDGTVAAWGSNYNGQLGTNSTTSSSVPVAVKTTGVLAGRTVVAIAAGDDFSLALCSDGTLATWGSNMLGQLGDNSATDSLVPVAVAFTAALADKTATAISAGGGHCLVLCSDGTLAGWGNNSSGQLGGLPYRCYAAGVIAPAGALAGRTPLSISAGSAHNLALCSDGTLAVWGINSHGQLGNNTTADSAVPLAIQASGVLAGRTVTGITAGGYSSLAVCSDGSLAAWGNNLGGQLGNNSGFNKSLVPQAVFRTGLAPDDRFVSMAPGSGGTHCLAFVGTLAPGIEVRGNDIPILAQDMTPNLADGTDFGSVALFNTQVTRTFTITNIGASPLQLGELPTLSGEAAADFQVISTLASPLAVGSSIDFAITYDPSLPGQRTATVTIATNDPLAPGFTFNIMGSSPLPTKLAQTITFNPPPVFYGGLLRLTASSSSGLPVTEITIVSGPALVDHLSGNDVIIYTYNTGVVKVQASLPASDRYVAAPTVTRNITIKAYPSAITFVGLNETYNGQPKPVFLIGSTVVNPTVTYKVGASYVADPPTAAGTYPVKAVDGTKTATGTLVVAKAPLYITPDDKHKFAGQANPALTFKYNGFVNNETAAVLTKAPVLKTTATGVSIGGTYSITASGATAANYTLIYRPGTLVVDSFAGAYEALLANDDHVPAGKLTITVAATSKTFTAKLTTADLNAPAFTGPLVTTGDQATGKAATTAILNKASTPYGLSFTLLAYGKMTASTTVGSSLLGSSSDLQKISTKAVLFAGAHTAVFEPATPPDHAVPAGAGWATVGAGSTGILTFSGKLGDGTAFTTTLSPDGLSDPGYRLFVQPYVAARRQSYLFGAFTLAPHPTLTNRRYLAQQSMTWQKTGLAADATYRNGFDAVSTVLMMDPWLPPAAATKTIPAISLAQRLGLSGTSISFGVTHSPTGSVAQSSLPTRLGLSAANAVSVLAPVTTPANKTKWKTLTFVPATGTFTGSFELTDDTLKRPVTFSGVLRQPASIDDNLIGDGHYLLPPMTGTEKTTGEMMFTRP